MISCAVVTYLGLLRSERFRFLIDDSKTTQARVDDLNKIIDEHCSKESTMSVDEFESFTRQWKENRKVWVPEKKLKEQEDQMRAEFLKKKAEYRDLLSSDITQLFPSNTANEANMGETKRFLEEYLEHKSTDEELQGFIRDRNLENDLSYFVQHLQSWNENLNESVRKFEKSLKINKQLFMKEVKRLNMFTPAVLLE